MLFYNNLAVCREKEKTNTIHFVEEKRHLNACVRETFIQTESKSLTSKYQ